MTIIGDIEYRRIAALWYVWGRQDVGADFDIDPFKFSEFHANQTAEYKAERRTFLPSVQDALKEYKKEQANGQATQPQ